MYFDSEWLRNKAAKVNIVLQFCWRVLIYANIILKRYE